METEQKINFGPAAIHLIAGLVTTHQMEPEDWDCNWDSISKKNRREIRSRVDDHNESLKILAIGLKASIEGLQEENRRLNIQLSNYAYQIDRAKRDRDEAQFKVMELEKELERLKFNSQ